MIRFERANPDEKIEQKIMDIQAQNKNYGYRRIYGELRNQKIVINKKKVQRIMQKLNLQVTTFIRKSRKYSSYRGKIGEIADNKLNRRFETPIHIKRLQLGLCTMRLINLVE